MALVQPLANKPQQIFEKKEGVFPGKILGANQVEVTLNYNVDSKLATKTVIVPKALISAMNNPGESNMGAKEAMQVLAEFHNTVIRPDLMSVVIDGNIANAIPAAILDQQVTYSYFVHATMVGTNPATSKGLHLDSKNVRQAMRELAAAVLEMDVKNVKEIPHNEAYREVTGTRFTTKRVTTEATETPKLILKVKEITCDMGSHTEKKNIALPEGATVETTHNDRVQQFTKYPAIKEKLDDVFVAVEKERGSGLDSHDRNAVVDYFNANYVRDTTKAIPIVLPRGEDLKN